MTGGGARARKLREDYRETLLEDSKDDLYHWKAIGTMDENAADLYDLFQNISTNSDDLNVKLQLTSEPNPNSDRKSCISIIKPSPILKMKDELPHSWAVTSDSIAYWFLQIISTCCVILVKDVPFLTVNSQPVRDLSVKRLDQLMRHSEYKFRIEEHLGKGTQFPVDPHLPDLMGKIGIPVLILNGLVPSTLKSVLNHIKNDSIDGLSQYGTLIRKKEIYS